MQGTSFRLEKVEWVGIMGESGSGKSTLFSLVLKFYGGYDGKILPDDKTSEQINTMGLRSCITLVSQSMHLFPGTLYENLLVVAPNSTEQDLMEAIEDASLKAFIDGLPDGLNTEIGENGVLLSGGERQCLSIAQGLLRKSDILLLDEVTSNPDAETEMQIINTIHNIRKKRNFIILSISHRPEFLKYAHKLYYLKYGILNDFHLASNHASRQSN